MKRILVLILTVILTASLTSCAGIGDGALNKFTSDIMMSLMFYDASGNYEAGCDIPNEGSEEFWELLHGEYVEGADRNAIEMPYVVVDFYKRNSSGSVGVYRVYSDDFVIQESSSGTIQKGHIYGLYDKLYNALPTVQHTKRAEQKAGFSFSSLMIATEPGKNYTVSDFPEIDCISVKSLMSTGETSWWVLTLDSDTKEEILDSLEKLKARDDILSVELDYIMTID